MQHEQFTAEDLLRSFLKHKIDDTYVWIEEEISVAMYAEERLGVSAEKIRIMPRSLWHMVFAENSHNQFIRTSFGEFLLHEYGHHYFVMPVESRVGSRYKHIFVAYQYFPPARMRLMDTLKQMFALADVSFEQVKFYGGGLIAHLSEREFQETRARVHTDVEYLLLYHLNIYRHLPDVYEGYKFHYLNLGLIAEVSKIETIGMGADNCPIDIYLVQFIRRAVSRRTFIDYTYGHIPKSALADIYTIGDGFVRGILLRPYVISVAMLDTDTRNFIEL